MMIPNETKVALRTETAEERFLRRTAPENLDNTMAEHARLVGNHDTAKIYENRAKIAQQTLGL